MARPRKTQDERRKHRKELWFNAVELASFTARAAEARMSPPDYARRMICGERVPVQRRPERLASIESTLAIMEIGKNLRTIADIAERSGQVPTELPALIAKLNHLLDRMIEQ